MSVFPDNDYKPELIDEVNKTYSLVVVGSKAVVVKENGPDAPIGERVRFLGVDAFKTLLGNRLYLKNEKWKSLAEIWLTNPRRRDYEGIEFAPCPDNKAGRPGYFNLWKGFEVEPDVSGDCTLLLRHIEEIVANGDPSCYEWVMAWFASIFQKPRERFGTSLTLRGEMGSGKSLPGEMIGDLIAPHYFPVDDPRMVTGQFNSRLKGCLLLQAEEAFWAGDKQAEGRLKGMVTSSRQMIEHKGVDPINMKNYVRLLVTSNEDWVIPTGLRERRFAVLDVSGAKAQNLDYFENNHAEMAKPGAREKLLYELLNFPLSAIAIREIPMTGALLDQKLGSADSVTQWWNECLEHGEIEPDDEWPYWLPTRRLQGLYRLRCERYHIRRPVDERSFGRWLRRLCPSVARKKKRCEPPLEIDDPNPRHDPPRRVWGYAFPRIAEARSEFEEAFGQMIDWEGEDLPSGERP